MRDFGIITDSTIENKLLINIFKDASNVSLLFMYEGRFVDEKTIIQNNLNESNIFIDSKINPKGFMDAIIHQKQLGYKRILILTSSNILTTSYKEAMLAKSILDDDSIDIIDTKTFGPGILYLLETLDNLIKKGLSYSKIIDKLNDLIDQSKTLIITNDYKRLRNHKGFIKCIKPFIKYYIMSKDKDYNLEKIFFKESQLLNYINLLITNYKGFSKEIKTYIFSGLNVASAKFIQHHLYNFNNQFSANLYENISYSILYKCGMNCYGIFLGKEVDDL
ncbi:DegV family protein [Acholeplasma granularum]|uniref:DegV family protein n=1 Tax=Acholeplasma granularum TaxID=264635 RepID=UPI0004B2EA38|nr:DegV family protein [Acholeplasma granularum]